MKITAFRRFKPLMFSVKDIAELLNIRESSARVTAHRYVHQGYLVRLKRDTYALTERWERAGEAEIYESANRLQVPSYVSFTTALSFYEITTQVQRGFFESAAMARTKEIEAGERHFRYLKLQNKLYFGFIKRESFFIATPEKAFLDSLYLMSLSRYRLDISALSLDKLDRNKCGSLSKQFPSPTQALLRKLWKR